VQLERIRLSEEMSKGEIISEPVPHGRRNHRRAICAGYLKNDPLPDIFDSGIERMEHASQGNGLHIVWATGSDTLQKRPELIQQLMKLIQFYSDLLF